MRRYPRRVRAAKTKCLSCNAPLTVTGDIEYTCVECGQVRIES